jgi:hypothetical protein
MDGRATLNLYLHRLDVGLHRAGRFFVVVSGNTPQSFAERPGQQLDYGSAARCWACD